MDLQGSGSPCRAGCLLGCGIRAPLPPADDARPGSSAGPAGKDKDKALPSFWIPSLTPEAKATKLEKPVSNPSTLCPLGTEGQIPQCPQHLLPCRDPQPGLLTLPPFYPAQSRTVTCPMSGKALRMSDLTPVRFTPLDSSVDRVGLITRSERYVCAVTRDSLSNATPCAVLRPS